VFTSGQSIIDKPSVIIPFSPALDLVLGGGVPEGSFMVFTGPPKCGKSVSSLDFAGTAQQLKYRSEFSSSIL
jgi:archaellum biogenesis ATPase FlaH